MFLFVRAKARHWASLSTAFSCRRRQKRLTRALGGDKPTTIPNIAFLNWSAIPRPITPTQLTVLHWRRGLRLWRSHRNDLNWRHCGFHPFCNCGVQGQAHKVRDGDLDDGGVSVLGIQGRGNSDSVSEELSGNVVGSNGEVALWRAVIDQALQDASTRPRIMPNRGRTFSSLECEKAREWFGRPGRDFALVCDCADLDGPAVTDYAKGVIDGGGRRRHARRPVG